MNYTNILQHAAKSKVLKGFVLLAALLSGTNAGAQPLPKDTTYTIGRLDNGLTYYIRHNAKEAGLADFYIAQRVGSILEEPRQRGLAHFLEHMAFNGTKHFPGNPSIVSWCESHGIRFGTNLNASTSVDQTVYHVGSVPVGNISVLDSTLLILHDWSNALLLDGKEIDKERGVIHEEWRNRSSRMALQRMIERVLPHIYAGTKYADCLPIGSMDIVDNFPHQDLRDYYKKWYRPDLQAIVVVGDVDVKAIETKIKRLFGAIPMPDNPAKRIYYPVPDNDKMTITVDRDSEQPIILANLYMKHDVTPDDRKDRLQYLRDNYINQLIKYMLNTRLQELQQLSEPPVLSASAKIGNFFVSRTKGAFSLSFGCRQEDIARSFASAVGETERARRHGFTAAELARAKAMRMQYYERSAKEGDNRRNKYYVNKATAHFLTGEPIVAAEDMLTLAQKFDSEVSLDEVNAATRQLISDKNQVLVMYAPDNPEVVLPSDALLEQYVLQAQSAAYEPYQDQALPESLIDSLPRRGSIATRIVTKADSCYTIASRELDGIVGKDRLMTYLLSNGVQVYVLPTTHDKDAITMRYWSEGGTNRFPDTDQPNFAFINSAVMKGGAGRFDSEQLHKMLAGKTVKVTPAITDGQAAIKGTCSPKDLETMMQLLHLYVAQPRRDSMAFVGEISRMRSFLTNREANPSVTYNDTIVKLVYGNSPRMLPTTQATLDQVDYDRIMQMYKRCFANARDFKMLIIGNVDTTALRPLLEKYVASLPARCAKCRHNSAKGKQGETLLFPRPNFVNEDATHLFRKKMNTPTARVTLFYNFQQPFTSKSDIAIDMLRRVLSIAYTDSVREDKGGVYGVGVAFELEKEANPTAMIKISFTTGPDKYATVMPLIYKQISNIANHGPLPSSLDKVKKYLRKNYYQNIIDNGYWDYVMYHYLSDGIDYHTDYLSLVDAIDAADVQAVARALLDSKRRIEITMLPEE